MSLSKIEIERRRQLISAGEWDDTWIRLANGAEFFSNNTSLVINGSDENLVQAVTDSGNAVFYIEDVVSARH